MMYAHQGSNNANNRGISLIEVLVVMLATTVLVAGVFQIYRTTENRQTEERKIASTSGSLRRIKESILSELAKVYEQMETSNYGFIMGQDGPVSLAAEAGNKFGVTTVSPDTLTFVYADHTKGIYQLAADFDPEASSISVKSNNVSDPSFQPGDLLLVANRTTFLLYQIDPDAPPKVNPGDQTLYELIPYNNPLFKAGSTALVSYQKTDNGAPITDAATMNNITTANGSVRAVNVLQYFVALNADDNKPYVYRKTNFDLPDATQMVGGPVFDMQFAYVSRGDFDNKLDTVDDMQVSKEISHVEINLRGSTKEQTLFAQGSTSLRGNFGGNLSDKLADLDANPSQPYANGDKPGSGIIIPNVEPDEGGFAIARALTSVNPLTNAVTGKLQIITGNGNMITPAGYGGSLPLPVLGVFRDDKGNILAPMARSITPGGAPNDMHASILQISTDGNGNITNNSTSNIWTMGQQNSITAMVFHNELDASTGTDNSFAMSFSPDTYVSGPGLHPDPARNLRVVRMKRNNAAGETAFNVVSEYVLSIPNLNLSTLIGGAVLVPYQPNRSLVVFQTSPAIGNGPDGIANTADDVTYKGALQVFSVNPNTLVPLSMDPTTNAIGGRRVAILEDGPFPGFSAINSNSTTEPTAFVLDAYTNMYVVSTTNMVNILAKYLANPALLPMQIKSTSSVNGQYYCSNTLPASSMSATYLQNVGTDFTYQGPMSRTAFGAISTGNGVYKTIASTGLASMSKELNFNANVADRVAATMFASIQLDTSNKVLNWSKVRVFSNANNAFGHDSTTSDMFIKLLPESADTLTSPCTVFLPRLDSPTAGDASGLQVITGLSAPGSTSMLANMDEALGLGVPTANPYKFISETAFADAISFGKGFPGKGAP